jgi:hypothetical protein
MSEKADYPSVTHLIEGLRKKATDGPSRHKTRAALREIEQAIKELGFLARDLDPIKRPEYVFDPRDPAIVGLFVGMALVAQERRALNAVTQPFYGSGVYALYYSGDFKPYAPISKAEHRICWAWRSAFPTQVGCSPVEMGSLVPRPILFLRITPLPRGGEGGPLPAFSPAGAGRVRGFPPTCSLSTITWDRRLADNLYLR